MVLSPGISLNSITFSLMEIVRLVSCGTGGDNLWLKGQTDDTQALILATQGVIQEGADLGVC